MEGTSFLSSLVEGSMRRRIRNWLVTTFGEEMVHSKKACAAVDICIAEYDAREGVMAERLIVLPWKGSEPDEGSGGSNPPDSAYAA